MAAFDVDVEADVAAVFAVSAGDEAGAGPVFVDAMLSLLRDV